MKNKISLNFKLEIVNNKLPFFIINPQRIKIYPNDV